MNDPHGKSPHNPQETDFELVAAPGVVHAIDTNTSATLQQTEAIKGLAQVLVEIAKELVAAIHNHDSHAGIAVREVINAIDRNTKAILELVEIVEPEAPPKATRITLTTAIETTTTEETPMPPLQLHPNQKLKATFAFNGAVDGEPVIVAQGGFTGASAQDPKVEGPAPDDPTKIQTTCVLHVYCTQPASIVAGGGGTYEGHPEYDGRFMISLPCTATVDNPDTGTEVEKIHEPFEFVAEWIPATQAKATTISMPGLEIEP